MATEGTGVERSRLLGTGFLIWLKEEMQWVQKLHSSYTEGTIAWVCTGKILQQTAKAYLCFSESELSLIMYVLNVKGSSTETHLL